MKALDLYSGVGGWSLGLRMAGVEVVASYEWWSPANQTNQINNGHQTHELDIRSLDVKSLPKDIDIVVGSPPCTQFSFANRGGQGDLEDGLKDIYKFFEIVTHVKPRFWAMENVPRVAGIINAEFEEGGCLHRFAKLRKGMRVEIINMDDFGVPQRRARCIAGNFDFDLLASYKDSCPQRTLGQVVKTLGGPNPVDPIYGQRNLPQGLTDHQLESPLDFEEERINREAKTYHPIYNNMPFPDPFDRAVRTITALCTRVSRESVVIEDIRNPGKFRRLSVRERASLQTFPIDFQFYGFSYQTKLKLIGNAVPPLMTFYIAQAMMGTKAHDLVKPNKAALVFEGPQQHPPVTPPTSPGVSYVQERRFRAAIPGLRFKSGMRFEFANSFNEGNTVWRVSFFYGTSKNIQRLLLDSELLQAIRRRRELEPVRQKIDEILMALRLRIMEVDSVTLQRVWTRESYSGMNPFEVIDVIGDAAMEIVTILDQVGPLQSVLRIIFSPIEFDNIQGSKKLLLNTNSVISGALVGAVTNDSVGRDIVREAA